MDTYFAWVEIPDVRVLTAKGSTKIRPLYRAKVPGGWLITNVLYFGTTGGGGQAMTFVPDPDHLWDGNTLP